MSNTRKRNLSLDSSSQSVLTDYFDADDTKPTRQPKAKPKQSLKRKRIDDEGTPGIQLFFQPQDFKKRRNALEIIANEKTKEPVAPIAITYREDGDGRGALYDHRGIQAAAKMPTSILSSTEYSNNFKKEIERFQYVLKFGDTIEATNHKYPPLISDFEEKFGLLLLPGVSAKEFASDSYKERMKKEQDHIAKARNKGQPILAICGGCWVLYQQYGGKIVEVTDHSYRAGMPRLSPTTGKIGNNKQIHRIAVQADAAILRGALQLTGDTAPQLPVNSVHSYAPDKSTLPEGLMIAALAVQDDELAPVSARANNTTKEKVKPEANTVEAFESMFGAPILGVQWHPEAYTGKGAVGDFCENQQHLIHYAAKAGQTYLNKRFLLDDFKANYSVVKTQLTCHDKLAYNHRVARFKRDGFFHFSPFTLHATNQLRHVDEVKWKIIAKENYCLEKMKK